MQIHMLIAMHVVFFFRAMLPLPGYDRMGRKVIVFRPGSYDPNKISMEVVQKASFMVNEIMGVESEQMFITGIVVVIDYQGFSMSHVADMPFTLIKKMNSCMEVKFERKKKLCYLIFADLISLHVLGCFADSTEEHKCHSHTFGF